MNQTHEFENVFLKQCPFCGSHARMLRVGNVSSTLTKPYTVVCKNEECGAFSGQYFATPQAAADNWNTRVDPGPVRQGHWISYDCTHFAGTDGDGNPIYKPHKKYKCSLCGRSTVIHENYCPTCGAKMYKDASDGI